MGDLTRQLATHIARTGFRELTPRAVFMAKCSLLDAIGVSLAASRLEPACTPFAKLAVRSGEACAILGFQQRASPLMAALANGALAHALDYEDTFDAAPAHPNAAGVPVALALLELDPSLTGEQLITAIALGTDLVCRLALALRVNPDRYGFYTPAILGAYGATVVASKLLGLDELQIVSAFALTLSQSTSSSQFKSDPQSDVRAVRDAFSAHAGLMAGLLAAEGVRGFEGAIDGECGLYALYARGAYDAAALCARLGQTFYGESVSFKPWPCCRGTHAFIESAVRLRERHAPNPADIERIQAHGAALNRMLMEPALQKRRPSTAIDAKFSLPYCVSLALLRGAPGLDDFGAERRSNADVLRLAARVEYDGSEATRAFAATSGRLELHMRDGSQYAWEVEHALGHPENPLDASQLIDKFVSCAGRAATPFDARTAHEIANAVLAIDQAPSAKNALQALLTAAQPASPSGLASTTT
jgi:2-methylcitrate dehydratase PrpD